MGEWWNSGNRYSSVHRKRNLYKYMTTKYSCRHNKRMRSQRKKVFSHSRQALRIHKPKYKYTSSYIYRWKSNNQTNTRFLRRSYYMRRKQGRTLDRGRGTNRIPNSSHSRWTRWDYLRINSNRKQYIYLV